MVPVVVLEEFHLTVRVARDLPDAEVRAIRRTFNSASFTARLRRAVRQALSAFPALREARGQVSR